MKPSSANLSKVFISYSHEDDKLLKELLEQLELYKQIGILDIWSDKMIKPGEEWREEIERAIASAKVAVLLISSSFLASQFIREIELPLMLAAAEKKGTIIMPVIVRPCNFADTELSKFQAVNDPSKPLTMLAGRYRKEEFWAKLANKIKEVIVLEQPPDLSSRPPIERFYETREEWGDVPAIENFYGRKKENRQLIRWIMKNQCKVIAVLGMKGIGKTVLAVTAARHAKEAGGEFDYIYWCTLENAPHLEKILRPCIQFVSDQFVTNLPESVHEQIELLIRYFKEHRCLLMLDNVEAVMQGGDHAGKFRKGYEGYGRLIQRLGEAKHKSTLLLTSREKPKEIRRLEGNTSSVRSLRLSSIGREAGKRIMKEAEKRIMKDKGKRLFGPNKSWEALIEQYGGNPLALGLAATFIHEFFEGDISRFLRRGEIVFGDINELLDGHFKQLSVLERDILYWLAIEREMTSLETLREDIVHGVLKGGALTDALESLLERFMIQASGKGHFSLQPVIKQYMTMQFIEQIFAEIDEATIGLLASHALIKAQAKDYIRNSQIRLILQPITEMLHASGTQKSEQKLKSILLTLRETYSRTRSYAAGNVLNLFIQLNSDICGYDFSNLVVWQAYLQGVTLSEVNFSHADLARSVFTETFGSIFSLKVSPDGNLLAAGTSNGDIRLWSLPGEKAQGICEGHMDYVWSVAFSPDGQVLASVSEDHSIRLWNINTHMCIRELPSQRGEVFSVGFSPDGRHLASAGNDLDIRLWDIKTGECLKKLEGHKDRVWSVVFSPDGKVLASGSHDQTARLWDVETGKCLKKLEGQKGQLWSVAFSPDGKTLASCSGDGNPIITDEKSEGNTIRLWEVATGQCIKELNGHKDWVYSVVFSPDGRILASSSEDMSIRIWDTSTYQCLQTLHEHTGRVRCLAFSPDSRILFSGSDDQTIRIWDTNSGQCLKTMQGNADRVRCLAFSPDGAILASDTQDENIRLWNSKTSQPFKTMSGHEDWIWSLAFSPDGKLLASCSDDHTIRLWEVGVNSINQSKILGEHEDWTYSIAFSPDGSILASGSEDCTIRLWDVYDRKCLSVLNADARIRSVAFNSNGNLLASGSDDHCIRLWDIKRLLKSNTGDCLMTLKEHVDQVRAIAFSPNGNILASGSDDRSVRLWDVESGQCLKVLTGHTNKVFSVAFSMDGSMLASGSEDRTVLLWDISNLKTAHALRLRGHTGQVRSVKFSPNRAILASGSVDGTIRLWDSKTGEELNTLRNDQPYKGLNITGVTGLTEAQKVTLKALGAIEIER